MSMTFRSSRITYYGPHPCPNCGAQVVKMAEEFGGNAFNQPDGPIYPNTEWFPHVCDPRDRMRVAGEAAYNEVKNQEPTAEVVMVGQLGFAVRRASVDGLFYLTAPFTYFKEKWEAWMDAADRLRKGMAQWSDSTGKPVYDMPAAVPVSNRQVVERLGHRRLHPVVLPVDVRPAPVQ